MIDSVYARAMRNGSYILFAVTVVIVVFSIISAVALVGMPQDVTPFQDRAQNLLMIFSQVFRSLQSAAWPFFGAALLWRMDKWLETKQ